MRSSILNLLKRVLSHVFLPPLCILIILNDLLIKAYSDSNTYRNTFKIIHVSYLHLLAKSSKNNSIVGGI